MEGERVHFTSLWGPDPRTTFRCKINTQPWELKGVFWNYLVKPSYLKVEKLNADVPETFLPSPPPRR